MYTHILIPTDGSELAQKGVDHGLALAKALGSKIMLVTATPAFPIPTGGAAWRVSPADIENYNVRCKKDAEAMLAPIEAQAQKMGIEVQALHVPDTAAAAAILETAQKAGCNLIVMASHGRRGVKRLLLGSQAAEVVASSPIPVLIVR
ncbi:universal stress protein [Aquamicrobium segne]|uniref:Universal stress protein n=1 Tax=Aquamicrobium segne TaxID=469547 RepID=A0ABW0H0M7_9HYPH